MIQPICLDPSIGMSCFLVSSLSRLLILQSFAGFIQKEGVRLHLRGSPLEAAGRGPLHRGTPG